MREPGSDKEKSGGDSGEEGSSSWADKNLSRSRLSVFEVSDKGIKTRTELLALANKQKQAKTDLAEFILNRGLKAVAEVLSTCTGWEMTFSVR